MSRRQFLLTTPQPQPVASCAAGVAAVLQARMILVYCMRYPSAVVLLCGLCHLFGTARHQRQPKWRRSSVIDHFRTAFGFVYERVQAARFQTLFGMLMCRVLQCVFTLSLCSMCMCRVQQVARHPSGGLQHAEASRR